MKYNTLMDHENSHGLVDGRIPAGKPCPFLKECSLFDDRCPSQGHQLKTVPYSCATARLFSIAGGLKPRKKK